METNIAPGIKQPFLVDSIRKPTQVEILTPTKQMRSKHNDHDGLASHSHSVYTQFENLTLF